MIRLLDALKLMDERTVNDKPQPFDIDFVSFNKTKGTGGEIIKLKGVVKCGASFNLKDNGMIAVRQIHSTNHPYPIHTKLILSINDNKVVW